ncbi:MAG TPA: glycosyltransferase family 39 protein [Candidatus Dormibacteraeota bacterium]
MALAFVVRLVLGLRTPLDPQEATLGLTALHIVHGQLTLMDPDAQYVGALDAYVIAPFVAVFGAGLTAIRIGLAFVGALTALTAYWFGRIALRRASDAVVAACVVAVFPVFAAYWSTRLHPGGAELLLLETICFAVAARIGWGRGNRLRWWVLLGFAAGLAVWSDPIFLGIVVAIAVGLLLRAPRIGWPNVSRGASAGLIAWVAGILPWLVYNVPNGFPSLHSIPRSGAGIGTGIRNLLSDQLPVLFGGASSCGHPVLPTVITDGAFAAVLLALLWSRWLTLRYLVAGHWTGLSYLDLVLLVIPGTLAGVVLTGVNANPCAAQTLLPIAVPLALGVAAILVERARWRPLALGLAAVWLVVSVIASAGTLPDSATSTASGTAIPVNLGPGVTLLEQHHPAAIWAEYSLSRLLSYDSGDTLPIAEYGGTVGFLARQQQVETALDPAWVFVSGDPHIAAFLAACRTHSIAYSVATGGGLVLYSNLSGPLEPIDVFSGTEARTS